MPESLSDLRARLARVQAAMDTVLEGGVAEFQEEGGNQARLLSLKELQGLETFLLQRIAAYKRRGARFVRIHGH